MAIAEIKSAVNDYKESLQQTQPILRVDRLIQTHLLLQGLNPLLFTLQLFEKRAQDQDEDQAGGRGVKQRRAIGQWKSHQKL